ncbi:Uncharacterized protein Mb2734 [Linum perenne]
MSKCFSFTASRDWFYRYSFANAGLRTVTTDLGDGTVIHCWVPRSHKACKPTLLLVHGFGANAMWQYGDHLRQFTVKFNVYVPDLLFFGRSHTSRSERSESFQAECLMRVMRAHGVERTSLVGISYGGFVGYSMAAQFPGAIEKIVLCCAGVCLEEKDMENGLFKVSNLDEAASILMPQTPEKLKELMRFSFVKPAKGVPTYFLSDFIDVMCTDYVHEKTDLIRSILSGRNLSELPPYINMQKTLIIWGDQDQIFPIELAHRLKRYLTNSTLQLLSLLLTIIHYYKIIHLPKTFIFIDLIHKFSQTF